MKKKLFPVALAIGIAATAFTFFLFFAGGDGESELAPFPLGTVLAGILALRFAALGDTEKTAASLSLSFGFLLLFCSALFDGYPDERVLHLVVLILFFLDVAFLLAVAKRSLDRALPAKKGNKLLAILTYAVLGVYALFTLTTPFTDLYFHVAGDGVADFLRGIVIEGLIFFAYNVLFLVRTFTSAGEKHDKWRHATFALFPLACLVLNVFAYFVTDPDTFAVTAPLYAIGLSLLVLSYGKGEKA